ncbi:MAG: low molecular weight phosphatase family protein [Micrococcus sp.]|nr:low molecular weight phosphatase family protein [Micrococcus sp.]
MDQNTTPQTPAQDDIGAARALDRNVLARTAAHLYERYAHVVDRETVDRVVQESYDELDRTAAVKTYLTASAGNFADSKLRSIAIARGSIEARNPRVLFVDDANAGRSQMAASLILKHTEGRITARSAGLEPAGSVFDAAVEAMAEVGVNLEHAYPKPLADDVHRAAQLVITFACADRLERVDGVEYRDWDIPSLEGRGLEDVRQVRDDIDARVRELITELGPAQES